MNINKDQIQGEFLLKDQNKHEGQFSPTHINRYQSKKNTSEMQSICSLHSIYDQHCNTSQVLLIACSMLTIILLMGFFNFYQSFLTSLILNLNLSELQKHSNLNPHKQLPDPFQILSFQNQIYKTKNQLYKLCPEIKGVFHVYYNKTHPNLQHINQESLKRATSCNVTILTLKDLKSLKHKWNQKFPQKTINLTQIQNPKTKQLLLILLQMYFYAGTYINLQIPYSKIDDKCWKYALTGYSALYADYSEITAGQIYVPDIWKFMKVRYPYGPEVRRMIERLIGSGDFIEHCKYNQCLIVECYQQ